MKKYMIVLEEELRNKIKASAAIHSMTMLEWILTAIREKLQNEEEHLSKEA